MLDFRLLGRLEIHDGDREIVLGGAKPKAVLAMLLVHRGELIPAERLIDALWGDELPSRAEAGLQVYVSDIRKALEPDRDGRPRKLLLTRSGGYELIVPPDAVDVARFERLLGEGRDALVRDEPDRAASLLREALGLWRGCGVPKLASCLQIDDFSGSAPNFGTSQGDTTTTDPCARHTRTVAGAATYKPRARSP